MPKNQTPYYESSMEIDRYSKPILTADDARLAEMDDDSLERTIDIDIKARRKRDKAA